MFVKVGAHGTRINYVTPRLLFNCEISGSGKARFARGGILSRNRLMGRVAIVLFPVPLLSAPQLKMCSRVLAIDETTSFFIQATGVAQSNNLFILFWSDELALSGGLLWQHLRL